jgi:hypothetical protein
VVFIEVLQELIIIFEAQKIKQSRPALPVIEVSDLVTPEAFAKSAQGNTLG